MNRRLLAAATVLLAPGLAQAADAEVRANSVSFDAGRQEVILEGDVRIDAKPFHLRSQHLRLRREGKGPLELEGKGRLAFCPCLGTPLELQFEGALVGPPADLVLKKPTLAIYGVPVFWLPYFWLRAPTRPGLLPPDVAYRARDGFYTGLGVHLPWNEGQDAIDLRGGAYFKGGGALDARLFTPSSRTQVRVDHLGTTGLMVDARGAADQSGLRTAWDVDLLRGPRAVQATTRLDEAARPWDRAAFEAEARRGSLRFSTGLRGALTRGGDVGELRALGPVVGARGAGAARGGALRYDSEIFAGALGDGAGRGASTFVRGEVGARLSGAVGPLGTGVELRGAADGAVDGRATAGLVAGLARATVGAPIARTFGGPPEILHRLEPFVSGGLGARTDGPVPFSVPPLSGNVPAPTTAVISAGLRSSLGRSASREALEAEAAAGALSSGLDPATPSARLSATASSGLVGLAAEAAFLYAASPSSLLVARARIGALDGPRLLAHLATSSGRDPGSARLVGSGGSEAPSSFLARAGTTLGGRAILPLLRGLSATAGAEGDLVASALLGAFGGLELRDPCRCVVVRAHGAHRLGREGIDVWLSLDIVTDGRGP